MGDAGPGLIERAERHGERRAIVAREGTFTYRDLLDASDAVLRPASKKVAQVTEFHRVKQARYRTETRPLW